MSQGPTAPALAMMGAVMATPRDGRAEERAVGDGPMVECQVVDAAGLPMVAIPYQLRLPEGRLVEGVLGKDGLVHHRASGPGIFEIVLVDVRCASWGADAARIGESVSMTAVASGVSDGTTGTFVVYRQGPHGPAESVATIETAAQVGQLVAHWATDTEQIVASADKPAHGASDYFFEVLVGGVSARSGRLRLTGDLALDQAGDANKEYVLMLPDGTARRGRLDGEGRAVERGVTPGTARVHLLGREGTAP